ncbi:MAG TPA: hypothetical protein VIL99_11440, partial [Ignavibacteria bacterium]
TPHLVWQANNGFVTFSYHLFERSASQYKFSFTLEYILGQMLFYGPVTAMFMYIALIKKREYDRFERALIWNILGISGFFLFCTLKGRVEINWTLPVIVPMLIIFMRYSDIRPVFRRRFYYGAAPVIVVVLLFRIQMIYPLFDIKISKESERIRAGGRFQVSWIASSNQQISKSRYNFLLFGQICSQYKS